MLGLCAVLSNTQAILLAVLFVGSLLFLYNFNKKKFKYWEERGVKFPKPRFILGNGQSFRKKSVTEWFVELYNKFPDDRYFGLYQAYQPLLVVRDLDLIKRIMVKDFEAFAERRTFINPENDYLWSNNLFTLNGDKWRDMRTTLSPSFTASKMKIMFVLMKKCAEQFVDYFNEQDQSLTQEVDIKSAFTRYANDVIATTAFGIECDSMKHKDNEFYTMGMKSTSLFGIKTGLKILLYALSPSLCKLAKVRMVPKDIADYFTAVIKDAVKSREEEHIIRPDMIHLLIEAKRSRKDQELKSEITIDDIVAQAFIFFLAGFDTTSTFLAFALYELALNPDVQSKLRCEILDQGDDEITYEKLLGMKYLDMVVSESLRKWPPMNIMDRKVSKSTTIQPEKPGEKPLILEKGVVCFIPAYAIQHDPKIYPEPEKFDPERFSDERKQETDQIAYLPFGAGPRSCIGMRYALLEGKLVIYKLLKEFEVVPVERTNIPMVLDNSKFVITSKGGMWLGLKKIIK